MLAWFSVVSFSILGFRKCTTFERFQRRHEKGFKVLVSCAWQTSFNIYLIQQLCTSIVTGNEPDKHEPIMVYTAKHKQCLPIKGS